MLEKCIQASLNNPKNIEASIKNMETRMEHSAKKLLENQDKRFMANTLVNPKEHCNVLE